ncbi:MULTISPECIES: type II toxin-antitoxin system PemK/MazF family toxin [unclassified Mumia]|uniref:type II toxin-antitoxin system PemK/MazF family toxin n=1 Tax=unclassified Mumia TaxID=2621872 RepID=UPI001FB9948E|nr:MULTISPECIES: type II toxin-antitoxin system PemK/MazF family toxin [unclassified Mumia]
MSRTRDLLGRLASVLAPSRRPSPGSSGLVMQYDPKPDGRPDPGEIVWTWVPYEDDPRQGKDRPVLLVGRRGAALVGVMLTSKDHDRDAADEARWGRYWIDIGSGGWDRQGRPSEVRLDRLITVDATAVRREGAVLDRARFDEVVAGVRQHADVR